MSQSLEVWIDLAGQTHRVGLCRLFRGGTSQFVYAQEWLDNPLRFAVDPTGLPLRDFPQHKRSLPSAVRDSAPDRWGRLLVERARRKRAEERPVTEADYLLSIGDESRIGALRYRLQGEEFFAAQRNAAGHPVPPVLRLPELLQAADAVQAGTPTAADLQLLLNEGSSLGGARPKSAVRYEDGGLAIAKFPKQTDRRSIPHGEVLAMQLAARAGLKVARARIQLAAGRPAAVIDRFDRRGAQRIHFVSALTLLGLRDGQRATYTDIAEVVRRVSASAREDLRELFSRAVFDVLVSNLDNHLRNHGFLYAGEGMWRLSPAYDINPVPLAQSGGEPVTPIAASSQGLEAVPGAAAYFGLKPAEAEQIAARLKEAVADWRSLAERIGMSGSDKAQYASAFRRAAAG